MNPNTTHPYRLETSDLARRLTDLLGARMVALIGGARDTRSVRAWIAGDAIPRSEMRLRLALQVAQIILVRDKPDVVRAWFAGINHHLEDQNPALLIADNGDDPSIAKSVIHAARAFISE